MNANRQATAIAPAPVSDVQSQIAYLEDSVSRLDAVTLNLLNRLAPVLRCAAPGSGSDSAGSSLPATELATQISTLASRVDSVRGSLAEAYERLGI